MKNTLLHGAIIITSSVGLFACETTKPANTSGSVPGTEATASPVAAVARTSGAVKKYPLDVCIVTDNKLGSMGDPVYTVYNGQQIGFCCKPCVKEFNANPETFMVKLQPVKP